jgi:hypothetical protein
MLAALGAIVMLSGMYAFFALRTSLTMVAVLMVMGFVLVAGQLFRIANPGDSAAGAVGANKGDASGR